MTQEVRKHWAALLLAALFTFVFFWLNSQKYLNFELQAPDTDRFFQAIWNTPRGRFLYSSIPDNSILAFHFSPFLALLSPLILIWSDIRILFLAQLIAIAACGLILYKIVDEKHRTLAPWFLLAFYLNASLHNVALYELRRVMFAMPFLALMFYGLYKDKKLPLVIGIIFSLLIKENLGLIVAMVGLYLLIFRRDWKWGVPILVIGLLWSASIMFWVVPELRGGTFTQQRYFGEWGESAPEITKTMLTHPGRMASTMFDQEGLSAIAQLLIPLGIVLPFLAPEFLLIIAPLFALMLLSSENAMHTLERWYLAPVIPILFGAIAVVLDRLSERKARWIVVVLLVATVAGFVLFSGAPLGGEFEDYRYESNERINQGWDIIDKVPDDAIVASQVAFITALADREHIYLYPWYSIGQENIEYFVMGRGFDAYPIQSDELDWEINNLIADPNIIVEEEAGGIYLLHQGGEQNPSFSVNRTAEEAIKLDRVEAAVPDSNGFFQSAIREPLQVQPGQTIRVTLYWEALSAPENERTVSVRLEDASGNLVGQHDMMPVQGSRPTSWWQPGWQLRDVYYLTVDPDAAPGPASLELVLYDSFTQERIQFDNKTEVLHLLEVEILETGNSSPAE